MLYQKILIKYRHPEIMIDVYLFDLLRKRRKTENIRLKNVSFVFLEKKISQLELHSNASNLFGFFFSLFLNSIVFTIL